MLIASDFVSTSAAAMLLAMSRERIVRLIQRGLLEAVEISGRHFVRRSSLEAYRRATVLEKPSAGAAATSR
jgi:excisionase family DNA binding protein